MKPIELDWIEFNPIPKRLLCLFHLLGAEALYPETDYLSELWELYWAGKPFTLFRENNPDRIYREDELYIDSKTNRALPVILECLVVFGAGRYYKDLGHLVPLEEIQTEAYDDHGDQGLEILEQQFLKAQQMYYCELLRILKQMHANRTERNSLVTGREFDRSTATLY